MLLSFTHVQHFWIIMRGCLSCGCIFSVFVLLGWLHKHTIASQYVLHID